MVIDVGYWTRVLKRIIIAIASIVAVYLAFKLAVFYMPFLIAFIISLMVEPIIRRVVKKTKLTRKTSAIVVLLFVFAVLIGLIAWGIASAVSEASNLLQGLNGYIEKGYQQIQWFIDNMDFEKIKIPEQVYGIIQNSLGDFFDTASNWVRGILTSLLNGLTQIPIIGIYIVITLLATYFICTDKLYILDQMEHHLPKMWIKKLRIHIKELTETLGGYLKAEVILIIISFVEVLVGLYIFKFVGFNIQYPLLAALGIGFVDALPILGSGTVMIPWAIISAINGDINLAIALLVLYVIVLVVRQLLEPRIVSGKIGIHPIFTLIAMYTGFKFMGVMGMLVGPIILIILKNIFGTFIDKGVVKTILDRG